MSSAESSTANRERDIRLHEIVQAFEAEARSGSVPSVQLWAKQHPEFATDILELFPSLLLMEHASSTLQDHEGLPQIPKDFGSYLVVRKIGQGGMGVVYLANDLELGRTVALKVILPGRLQLPGSLERFQREAKASAGLSHPNIVPVFASGEDSGMHFYAMQFIDGFSLEEVFARIGQPAEGKRPGSLGIREWIAEMRTSAAPGEQSGLGVHAPSVGPNHGLSYREASRVGREIASALTHAHSHGVLHRDIKPANVLLDDTGNVWVADFGLCRLEGDASLTQEGDVVGTLRYMAPEQLEGEGDERSDVYGAGLVLYEMLCGRPAFDEARKGRLVKAILTSDPVRPGKLRPGIPKDLETIVLKAIAKEPNVRYASAAALARDLESFEGERAIEARPLSAWYWLSLFVRRQKWLTATLVVSFALVATLVALYTQRLTAKEEQRALGEYSARINAAEAAVSTGATVRALTQLQLAEPALRGWEWYHLRARADQSLYHWNHGSAGVRDVTFSPGGQYLAAASTRGAWLYESEPDGYRLLQEKPGDAYLAIWNDLEGHFRVLFSEGDVWTLDPDIDLAPQRVGQTIGSPSTGVQLGDGRLLLGTYYGQVGLFNLAAGTSTVLHERGDAIGQVLQLGDGSLWACDQNGWTVRWNLDGIPVEEMYPNQGARNRIRMSPQGRWVASAPGNRPVVLFNGQPGVGSESLADSGASLSVLAFSPDERRLAGGGEDGRLSIWDLSTKHRRTVLSGHSGRPMAMEWDSLGARLATGDDQGSIHVWNPDFQGGDRVLGHLQSDVFSIDVSRDDTRVVVGGRDGTVFSWDVSSGERGPVLWTLPSSIGVVQWTGEGSRVLLELESDSLELWDLKGGTRLHSERSVDRWENRVAELLVYEEKELAFVTGRRVASSTRDGGCIEEWDLAAWKVKRTFEMGDQIPLSLCLDKAGQRLFVSTQVGQLWILDLASGKWVTKRKLHPEGKRFSLDYDPTTHRGLVIDWSERAWVLDMKTLELLGELVHPGQNINCGTFLSSGNRIALGTRRGTIAIWDPKRFQHFADIDSLDGWVMSLRASEDGSRLFAGDAKGGVHCLDLLNASQRRLYLSGRDLLPLDRSKLANAAVAAEQAANEAWRQIWTGDRHLRGSARLLAIFHKDAHHEQGAASAVQGAVYYFTGELDWSLPQIENAIGNTKTPKDWMGRLHVLRFWLLARKGRWVDAWNLRRGVTWQAWGAVFANQYSIVKKIED